MNARREELQIAEAAADWLLRLQTEPEADLRGDFSAWLKHSPRHVEEFLLMSAVLRVAKQGARHARIDVDAMLSEATPNVVVFESAAPAPLPLPAGRWRRTAPALAAAAALLAIGLGALTWRLDTDTYVTPVGEQRSIKLPDGSFVYLNTHSRMQVDYSDRRRDVRLLEGEALFVVARETARPFRVLSDAAVIQAVGTQFNVYRHDGATTVSVIDGRVKIARSTALLFAGDRARVTADGRVTREHSADIANALAWRQRRLVFQSDTLADIAREFNRYNRTQIRVEGEAAAQRRFTAVFNADEPQALLMFLHADPQLSIEPAGADTLIRSRVRIPR